MSCFGFPCKNAINAQFSNLGVVLLQNFQQAQMTLFSVDTSPIVHPPPIREAIKQVFPNVTQIVCLSPVQECSSKCERFKFFNRFQKRNEA
ncbi:hypothetical protein JHK82_027667 [Glycine max]|nr:hypothetical protein JHK82_027667 [Glycine max]